MTNEQRSIPTVLLQATINYLATRPYAEVYQMLPALQALPKIEAPAEEPTKVAEAA